MLVLQLAEHVFVGQSTIGISLLKLETPYADPHVRCCERCDAKTSAYSIVRDHKVVLRIRRRRWLDAEGHNVVFTNYELAAAGTSYSKEFAGVLKKIYGHLPYNSVFLSKVL